MSSARLLFMSVRFWLEKIKRDLSATVSFRRVGIAALIFRIYLHTPNLKI